MIFIQSGRFGSTINYSNVKQLGRPTTAKRYWRIVVTGHLSNGAYIAEIEFRNTGGGPDLTTPAMTVLGTFGFNPKENAFDNNTGTPTFGAVGDSIGIDFGVGNSQIVEEVAITHQGSGQTFVHGYVQSSDDNVTWVNEWQMSKSTIAGGGGTVDVFRYDDVPDGLFADFRVNADPPVEGYSGVAFTKTGSPSLNTTTKLFDPSSGNVLNFAPPAGWAQIGTGDWTMEIHIQNVGSNDSLNAPGLQFYFYGGGFTIFSGATEVFSTTGNVFQSALTHYAIVRRNNQMFFYRDGVSFPCSQTLFTLSPSWSVMGGETSTYRITSSQFGRWLMWRHARYTGEFTPPQITDTPLYEPSPPSASSTYGGLVVGSFTQAVPLSGTINAGDLIVVVVTRRSGSVTWDNSTAGTWTSQFDLLGAGGPRLVCRSKVATGTESGLSLSLTMSNARDMAYQVFIYPVGVFVAIEAATVESGTTTAPNCPNLTPSWGSQSVEWIAVAASVEASPTVTSPSGYASQTLQTSAGGAVPTALATARKTITAVSENPPAWARFTSGATYAATIGIRLT